MLFAAIVLFAAFVETLLGFGKTVLVVALASQLWPIREVLPVLVPLNLLLSAYLVLRHGRFIDRRLLLRRILPFMGAGFPFGLLLFHRLDAKPLQLGFAAFLVVLSSVELVRVLRARGTKPQPLGRPAGTAALLVAGLIHGLYATGGPMLVYYVSRELPDRSRFRSTLAAVWLTFSAALMASYAYGGQLDAGTLARGVPLLAPVVLGIVLGEWAHAQVREDLFRKLIYVLLLFAGGLLALRA